MYTVERRLWPILCLIFLLPALPACAQREFGDIRGGVSGGVLLPQQGAYDVTHYDLRLTIDPAAQTLQGTATVSAKLTGWTNEVALDLDPRFDVSAVRLSDSSGEAFAAEFVHTDGRVWVTRPPELVPGDAFRIEIDYGGMPKVAPRPPWLGGFTWSSTSTGAPWVGVSCQMDGADVWWPCKDHPSDKPDSLSLHVRVPDTLVAVASGRLRGVDHHDDGTATWNWHVSTPISNYALSLNIAPYRAITGPYKSVDGTEFDVTFWVLPERYEEGLERYEQFKRELRFLEETLGPYPFRADKYGVVHTPYLGMEHQTIIAYGSTFNNNEYGFDWLHFHELAHEWYANLVTAADWKDFWIHEGTAVYLEALYAEKLGGTEAYHRYLAGLPALNNQKPVAPATARDTREMYFSLDGSRSDNDIYNKGALILHTLRHVIGEETLLTALRRMCYPSEDAESTTDGSHVRLVDTEDFIELVETLADRDLSWFFETYLRHADLPELVTERTGTELHLNWIAPDANPFPMPIDVVVNGETHRVDFRLNEAILEIPVDAVVEVDPLNWVLRAATAP